MANAATKVRKAFIDADKPMTLSEIKAVTDLRSSEISMALCYLTKWRYLTREIIGNEGAGRKKVWSYTYHKIAIPKDQL